MNPNPHLSLILIMLYHLAHIDYYLSWQNMMMHRVLSYQTTLQRYWISFHNWLFKGNIILTEKTDLPAK